MPPLLCASPVILDQSFPRNEQELRTVAISLGEIEKLISENRIHVLLTDVLGKIILDFNWNRNHGMRLLIEIFRLLNQWFLQPHTRLIKIDVSAVKNYSLHPLPKGISQEQEGLSNAWADEVGRLLFIHDGSTGTYGFCIGIACEHAFCGNAPNTYNNPDNLRCFPMVGPNQIENLEDAYEWEKIPSEVHSKNVSFDDVIRNIHVLGAVAIEPPQGDSHYKVSFPGKRPWTLDRNVDPVPDRFLKELEGITDLPLLVIKSALLFGTLPRKNVLRVRLIFGK